MAQSALTVTPPNPSPPTNFSSTGVTGPNPPNYTKTNYANPFNLSATGKPSETVPGVGVNPNPPPFFDDGTAGSLVAFAANTAALAGGTGATSGGTEGTYPGGTVTAGDPPWRGAVPASTSVAHEGAGTEVVATATSTNPGPYGQLQTVGAGPPATLGAMVTPNASHASSLSPATNPALASIAPTTAVSGASGTDTITCTGTNFTRQSVVWVQHGTLPPVAVTPTTFTSATTISAAVPKRTSAGASTIFVITGGVVTTVTKALTYS